MTTPYPGDDSQPATTPYAPPAPPVPPTAAAEHPTVQLPATTPAAPVATSPAYQGVAVPQYQAQPAGRAIATTVKDTNTYALVAILLTFAVPLAGIIFGHLGLNQIKRTGDAGRGLALTAVIYGYCSLVLLVLFLIAYIGIIIMAITAAASGDYYL